MTPALCVPRTTRISVLLSAALVLIACQPAVSSLPAKDPAAASQPATAPPAVTPQPAPRQDQGTPTPLLNLPQILKPYQSNTASDPYSSPRKTAPILLGELNDQHEETIDKSQPTLLPDSEVVYSPTALDFDITQYIDQSEGYIREFREYLRSTGWTSSAEIVRRVALENSINPRLLLALIEYQTHSVRGQPEPGFTIDYLLGGFDFHYKGFYRQLSWAASQLSVGYYGWRDGTLDEIWLSDGTIVSPVPDMNAGSVALQYYFAQVLDADEWRHATAPQQGLVALYADMYPKTLPPSQEMDPLVPNGLTQPELILPFETDDLWGFTSGPHSVWDTNGAQAALDFAPATTTAGCVDTNTWVVAVADGPVVRSEFGAIIQDLSGDGLEQTGWAILYLHVRADDHATQGTYLHTGDRIGHPSCEGGRATGTHLHIARKYNGEWITAGGSLPIVLSGWTAHAGSNPYEGSLTRGKRTVIASPYGIAASYILRTTADP